MYQRTLSELQARQLSPSTIPPRCLLQIEGVGAVRMKYLLWVSHVRLRY
jgi:hypothetical protein